MSKQERARYKAYLEDLRYQASMMIGTFQEGEFKGRNEGKVEGRIEGRSEGKLIGKIELLREMAELPPLEAETLEKATLEELEAMLTQLKKS